MQTIVKKESYRVISLKGRLELKRTPDHPLSEVLEYGKKDSYEDYNNLITKQFSPKLS